MHHTLTAYAGPGNIVTSTSVVTLVGLGCTAALNGVFAPYVIALMAVGLFVVMCSAPSVMLAREAVRRH